MRIIYRTNVRACECGVHDDVHTIHALMYTIHIQTYMNVYVLCVHYTEMLCQLSTIILFEPNENPPPPRKRTSYKL